MYIYMHTSELCLWSVCTKSFVFIYACVFVFVHVLFNVSGVCVCVCVCFFFQVAPEEVIQQLLKACYSDSYAALETCLKVSARVSVCLCNATRPHTQTTLPSLPPSLPPSTP